MTLLYDDSLEFCDKHPGLCQLMGQGEPCQVEPGPATVEPDYERYELGFESDRPEYCQI
jgi:hypothetical protein